jgi:hypothetical protein
LFLAITVTIVMLEPCGTVAACYPGFTQRETKKYSLLIFVKSSGLFITARLYSQVDNKLIVTLLTTTRHEIPTDPEAAPALPTRAGHGTPAD